jgi:nucleoside 2-deoxyribosyltransferase
MRVYVASSWRNNYQPLVVQSLRKDGHDVYDFKDSEGFHWSEVDPEWQKWTPQSYIKGLSHTCAERGFNRDMKALRECDACVYVMPCGPSASMEMGWAVGAGKPTAVYIPELREPDLMVKMAGLITDDLQKIRDLLLFREVTP